MPKLNRDRQESSADRVILLVPKSKDQNSQRLLPSVPVVTTVKAVFLSGATCRPAIPAGAGPIGAKSNLRVLRSKFAMPNTRLCTIGSDELKSETRRFESLTESRIPPKPIASRSEERRV